MHLRMSFFFCNFAAVFNQIGVYEKDFICLGNCVGNLVFRFL